MQTAQFFSTLINGDEYVVFFLFYPVLLLVRNSFRFVLYVMLATTNIFFFVLNSIFVFTFTCRNFLMANILLYSLTTWKTQMMTTANTQRVFNYFVIVSFNYQKLYCYYSIFFFNFKVFYVLWFFYAGRFLLFIAILSDNA